MRLFKELYKIEFDNDQKNIYSVKIRNVDGTNNTKNFESSEEADSYYDGLDKKEVEEKNKRDIINAVREPVYHGANDICHTTTEWNANKKADDIIEYIKSITPDGTTPEKAKTSARHLNAKFKLKLSQKDYNKILGL